MGVALKTFRLIVRARRLANALLFLALLQPSLLLGEFQVPNDMPSGVLINRVAA